MVSPVNVSHDVKVEDLRDRLPVFWNENAVFVANLLGLFFGNEQETRMLAEEVGEVDSYGGRLLPVIDLLFAGSGRNLLVLEREPDPVLSRYFVETAALSLPDVAVLEHKDYMELGRQLRDGRLPDSPFLEILRQHPAGRLDGYVTDDILSSIASMLGMDTFSSFAGSHDGNNKWLLHRHLEAVGLPTPATEIAESPGQVANCLERLRHAGYSSAVIKSPIGASGIGLIKVDDLSAREGQAADVAEHFFAEGPCMVQGWIKAGEFGVARVHSPSAQLFLNDDSVFIYDLTEQILSHESVHEGNESPPPYLAVHPDWREEMIRQAGEAARWLHGCGYRGTASADFLLTENESGGFTLYVCELNARVTGATYPSVLARHFMPGGAWLLRNLRFTKPMPGAELMELLRTAHDLFVPGESERGIMPLNFNTADDGLVHKGQFLCLAPSSEGSKMLLELARLDMPCTPDRD